METSKIIKAISEEMDEMQFNDVIMAMCKGFERINPQKELVCMVLPKQGKEEREKILHFVCQQVMEEEFDKVTGKPIIRRKDTGKHLGDLNS